MAHYLQPTVPLADANLGAIAPETRRCAYAPCGREFVAHYVNERYCSDGHKRQQQLALQRARRARKGTSR